MSDVSLRQIEAIESTVIGRALQQVLDESYGPQEAVAGFDAFQSPVDDAGGPLSR
ncbi:FxSxx-COOH cyclophane-containing RiPP peptide [Actinomadura sediminis]|uniref:FxSxx-COOH cyclophane-containing RiPP peptide n=1 Tax=Actinomadura sediminis TaxID=1038904 RepID=A0ABW3ELT5_9ACTN